MTCGSVVAVLFDHARSSLSLIVARCCVQQDEHDITVTFGSASVRPGASLPSVPRASALYGAFRFLSSPETPDKCAITLLYAVDFGEAVQDEKNLYVCAC